MSAVIKLCAAVVQHHVGRDDAEAEPWRLLALAARDEIDQLRRATARAEVERMRERIATQDDGLRYGEKVCADLMAEINGLHKKLNALEHAEAAMMCETDKLRAERRLLRDRLVACLPFVGICPREPDRIQLMRLVRDLADETLEEVQ